MTAPSYVVVAVPARDEQDTVAACLASIDRAAVHAGVPVAVVLGADRCTDDTEQRASSTPLANVRLELASGCWRTAGAARAAAIGVGLRSCPASAAATWIATTDADTVVADDWLRRQLDHAANGADAVAGIVELRDDHHRDEHVADTFRSLYRLGDGTHDHVHGANLGVRADWYAAAGGFAAVEVGEDHHLWVALHRLGARCLSTIDVRVATSARLHGRATGGFADLLRTALEEAPA